MIYLLHAFPSECTLTAQLSRSHEEREALPGLHKDHRIAYTGKIRHVVVSLTADSTEAQVIKKKIAGHSIMPGLAMQRLFRRLAIQTLIKKRDMLYTIALFGYHKQTLNGVREMGWRLHVMCMHLYIMCVLQQRECGLTENRHADTHTDKK